MTTRTPYVATTTDAGTTATDSNSTPSGTTPVSFDSGVSAQTIDFCFYQPVIIRHLLRSTLFPYTTLFRSEPGINGVTLTLNGTTGAGVSVGPLTTTTVTNAGQDGYYQ